MSAARPETSAPLSTSADPSVRAVPRGPSAAHAGGNDRNESDEGGGNGRFAGTFQRARGRGGACGPVRGWCKRAAAVRLDGATLAASVAGRDPAVDLAIVRVDAGALPVADIATETARVGHIVLAIGRGTRASWGVISAIGDRRRPRAANEDLLALDLTMYPGFSGGPLVDARGRVVGITTSGSRRHLQLAIPAATVDRLVDELLRRGHLPRAYVGVATQAVQLGEPMRQRLGTEQRTAVIVVDVQPESPAARAGILIGDVIVAVGQTQITEPTELRAVLRPEHVGETLSVSVVRGGEPRDVRLTVGDRARR